MRAAHRAAGVLLEGPLTRPRAHGRGRGELDNEDVAKSKLGKGRDVVVDAGHGGPRAWTRDENLFLVALAYDHRGGGAHTTEEGKYTKTLKIRIDPELHERVRQESERLGTDVSTYVRWCIQTGLYLKDLNLFIRSKEGEGR